MDSDHGVLPLPVATRFLPVNPLIYTHFSVCLAACPLPAHYRQLLYFSFLSLCLSILFEVSLEQQLFSFPGTSNQHFNCTFSMIAAGMCRKSVVEENVASIIQNSHHYGSSRRTHRLTLHVISRDTQLGCSKVLWKTEPYGSLKKQLMLQ